MSLSVCSNNKYVVVDVGDKRDNFVSSRMFIFEVNGSSLVKTERLDQYTKRIRSIWALESFGYAGTQAIWIGLLKDGWAQLYSYDSERKELRELQHKKVLHKEYCPNKPHRLDGKFLFTGDRRMLMCFCFRC